MNLTKILVTGGAGYIGSHTIIELVESGRYNVISADNFSNSTPDTFDKIESITGSKIINYNVDLCDLDSTKRIFSENPDIKGIIHFAAFKSVPDSIANPDIYHQNNMESLKNILECLKLFSVPHLIFSSSCSVYGSISSLPVKEDTPLNKAESPYGLTKQLGEKLIAEFSKNNPQISSIILRYFNPVGAHISGKIGESPIKPLTNLLPIITRTASGKMKELTVFGNNYDTRDGTCIRDYIHVSDIAAAHVYALNYLIERKNNSNYSIFNLGTGRGVTILEAILSFEKTTGIKLNYKIGARRNGDVPAVFSDSTKAFTQLKWKPKFGIDQMMQSAWKWELAQK